jgi:hypothetical protein
MGMSVGPYLGIIFIIVTIEARRKFGSEKKIEK